MKSVGLIEKKNILKNIINRCKGNDYTINQFLDVCSIHPIHFHRTLNTKETCFELSKLTIQKIVNNADKSVDKISLEKELFALIDCKDISIEILRGQIYWVDFGTNIIGSEQGGIRPGLIIQNNVGNKYSPTVVAIAITTQLQKSNIPAHALIDILEYETGLDKDSVVLTEQIRTVDKKRVLGYIGECPHGLMRKIEDAFRIQYGISTPKVDIADFVTKFTSKINVSDKFRAVLANEMKKYFEENEIEFKNDVNEYINEMKQRNLAIVKRKELELNFVRN